MKAGVPEEYSAITSSSPLCVESVACDNHNSPTIPVGDRGNGSVALPPDIARGYSSTNRVVGSAFRAVPDRGVCEGKFPNHPRSNLTTRSAWQGSPRVYAWEQVTVFHRREDVEQ